jgi:hypothetical protein
MSEVLPEPNSNDLPPHEFVARAILPRFPNATLATYENQTGTTFDIHFRGKPLVSLNKRDVRYFFPTRRKRMIKWDRISASGLARVTEYILRDLAQADYEVLSKTNKEILKRPIHISRYKRCPQCRNGGGIKIILRAESVSEENSQIYTPISRAIELNGAEIKCILCDWIGVREELLQKIRRSRKSADHEQR